QALERLWVEFNGATYRGVKVSAKASPAWLIDLDLGREAKAASGDLWIKAKAKTKEPDPAPIKLSNVAVGDVWLLAETEGQGVPAHPPNERQFLSRDRVRFVSLGDLAGAGTEPSAWLVYPQTTEEFQQFSALTVHLADYLVKADNYVGIVLTHGRGLED